MAGSGSRLGLHAGIILRVLLWNPMSLLKGRDILVDEETKNMDIVILPGTCLHRRRKLLTHSAPLQHQPGRTEYQRGTFTQRNGEFEVGHTGDQGSNRLSTFHNANCLIEVNKAIGNLQSGDWVNILPLTDLTK